MLCLENAAFRSWEHLLSKMWCWNWYTLWRAECCMSFTMHPGLCLLGDLKLQQHVIWIINTTIWSPKLSCLQPVATSRWCLLCDCILNWYVHMLHESNSICMVEVSFCCCCAYFSWLAFIVFLSEAAVFWVLFACFNSDITSWNWVIIW